MIIRNLFSKDKIQKAFSIIKELLREQEINYKDMMQTYDRSLLALYKSLYYFSHIIKQGENTKIKENFTSYLKKRKLKLPKLKYLVSNKHKNGERELAFTTEALHEFQKEIGNLKLYNQKIITFCKNLEIKLNIIRDLESKKGPINHLTNNEQEFLSKVEPILTKINHIYLSVGSLIHSKKIASLNWTDKPLRFTPESQQFFYDSTIYLSELPAFLTKLELFEKETSSTITRFKAIYKKDKHIINKVLLLEQEEITIEQNMLVEILQGIEFFLEARTYLPTLKENENIQELKEIVKFKKKDNDNSPNKKIFLAKLNKSDKIFSEVKIYNKKIISLAKDLEKNLKKVLNDQIGEDEKTYLSAERSRVLATTANINTLTFNIGANFNTLLNEARSETDSFWNLQEFPEKKSEVDIENIGTIEKRILQLYTSVKGLIQLEKEVKKLMEKYWTLYQKS